MGARRARLARNFRAEGRGMSMGAVRVGAVLAGCLWLTACATDSATNGNWFTFPSLFRPSPEAEATGSTDTTAFPSPDKVIPTTVTPSEPNDDLSLAKENFREGNYGLAERYFRKAVEAGPRDAEAWLGLAASYPNFPNWRPDFGILSAKAESLQGAMRRYVVKTHPLLGFWFVHRIAGHVLAIRTATEGRQGTPLLEHCRKQALFGRSGGAAAASVSG